MIRSVLAACLATGAFTMADESDPLLRLEHGLWLQEVQWDFSGAMKEYQAAISTPGAPGRVQAEARYFLAGCYLEKDSPSAALALYQTIVRNHSDVIPFGRLASERMTETNTLIERTPILPSRHLTSRLGDRLLLLRAALREGEKELTTALISDMQSDLAAQSEELALVPTNEPAPRAALRAEAVSLLNAQTRALREIAQQAAAGEFSRSQATAEGDLSLARWLERETLWQAAGDWAALVATQRVNWIAALSEGNAPAAQMARAAMLEMLQPVSQGPRGNPEVQTALRTLEMLQALEPQVRSANWPMARQQLATEITGLYGRYTPAATVRPPNAAGLDAAMLTQLVTVLTHVVEAVAQIDQTSRVERVTSSIDGALQTARKLVEPWRRQDSASRRLQETISQLERAKTEAGIDLQRARRLLRAEIYD